MKIQRGRRRQIAEINVVPYIDVMLVLLVIFMITAPLLNQGVKVDLPKAQAGNIDAKDREPIVVSVNAQGQYFLNIAPHPEQAIDADGLKGLVTQALTKASQQQNKRSVMVKADRSVNYGLVVQAMVLLQQAGAESVGLVTDPADLPSTQNTTVKDTKQFSGNAWRSS